jgi:hypothetical protein
MHEWAVEALDNEFSLPDYVLLVLASDTFGLIYADMKCLDIQQFCAVLY